MGNPIKLTQQLIIITRGLHLDNKMKILFFIVCAVLYQCSTVTTLCNSCGNSIYWPSDCPSVQAIGMNPNVCQNSQFYNDSIQEQLCLTPTCIEPLVDCYQSNCSEQTAAFLKDVLCGRNNEGNLCWNLFAEEVMSGSIMCNSCHQLSMCTATCKMTVQSIIDKLGCCAALFLNNTNLPIQYIIVQTAVLNDCNVTIGEKCTGLSESTMSATHSPSPSTSPLTSLSSTYPPSPIGTPSPTQTPTDSGSTFKANVVVFVTTFVVLLASLG